LGPQRRTIYTLGCGASTVPEPGSWVVRYGKPSSMPLHLEWTGHKPGMSLAQL